MCPAEKIAVVVTHDPQPLCPAALHEGISTLTKHTPPTGRQTAAIDNAGCKCATYARDLSPLSIQ